VQCRKNAHPRLAVATVRVLRRLAGFERALGARLFENVRAGRRGAGRPPHEVARARRRGVDSLLPAALAGLAATHPTVGSS
jgi:hypothetical protein